MSLSALCSSCGVQRPDPFIFSPCQGNPTPPHLHNYQSSTTVLPPIDPLALKIQQIRQECKAAGLAIDEHAITIIKQRPSLLDRLRVCEFSSDFINLYDSALWRFGTSTKNSIVAVEPKVDVVIDGEFQTEQNSSSIFYRAFVCGLPCVLKFHKDPSVTLQELNVYEGVIRCKGNDDDKSSLVPIRQLRLTVPVPRILHSSVALQMDIYVGTLASCPRSYRMTSLVARAANFVGRALGALHANSVGHNDVKPSNIFISHNGEFKLGDYDAVQSFGEKVERTTDEFLPKEYSMLRSNGELHCSPQVDFGMLACTIAFMIDFPIPQKSSSSPSNSRSHFSIPDLQQIVSCKRINTPDFPLVQQMIARCLQIMNIHA